VHHLYRVRPSSNLSGSQIRFRPLKSPQAVHSIAITVLPYFDQLPIDGQLSVRCCPELTAKMSQSAQ